MTFTNHLLNSLELVWLDPEMFANAIHDKGAPLDQCWGFIDGTARPIARPIHNPRIMYSGHKRIHCTFITIFFHVLSKIHYTFITILIMFSVSSVS